MHTCLLTSSILSSPDRISEPGSWAGHIPFAMWIVEQVTPKILVELGTHSGNSYFSFCQSVLANGLSTQCYAVDTWQGDEQAGYYGEEIYQSVLRYNDQHYGGFSRLLRSTFDDAAAHFADGTIDILHIDGLHTYEAVRHDFEIWFPKLSARAVVLFHDINVREGDFGVWRLWDDLALQYPHIRFLHSHGLGVLFVGKERPKNIDQLLDLWGVPGGQVLVCRLFERLGHGVGLELATATLQQQVAGMTQDLLSRRAQLQETEVKLQETEAKLQETEAKLQETEAKLQETEAKLQETEVKLQETEGRLTTELQQLRDENTVRQLELQAVYKSRSWRLTKPVRWAGRIARLLRHCLLGSLRSIYHYLPLPLEQRASIRAWYYRNAEGVLPTALYEYPVTAKTTPPPPAVAPFTRAALVDAPLKILLIERSIPKPNQDAGSMMIYNFIKVFRGLGYAVTFFPADLAYDPDYTPALQDLGVTCLHYPDIHSLQDHLATAGSSYDSIVACRPDHTSAIIPVLRAHCPQAQLLYETHDLHFVREQRQAELEQSAELLAHARWRKAQELQIAATVDCTIVVSEQERQTLLQENSKLYVEVIPVVGESFGCGTGFSNRRDLIFIGGYDHRPNVDAVLYFVREIMPLVTKQHPEIFFHVVGSNPTPEINSLADSNVIVHGFVPDITDLMRQVKISVNPLRFGAGVKGKLVTSMSYGVPCIGTSIAFEGMGVVSEQQALVVDTPETFADAVLRLYNDQELWERLSEAGMALAHKCFSLEVAAQGFARIFSTLLGSTPRNGLYLERVASHDAWKQLNRDSEQRRREAIEADLAVAGEPIVTHGFCFVCGKEVSFHTDFMYGFTQSNGFISPNWRERVVCPECHLNNRMRAAIHLFHLLCAPTPESRLYLTEQTTPLFSWFQHQYSNVIGSEYLGDTLPAGAINSEGIRNESLTMLSFANNQFDSILSFDVIEHIPDYLQAFRECLRCLKPGGTLFFTVPFAHQSQYHIVRAKLDEAGEIHHLLPPEYHGDPIKADGCLCFYHFGWELLDQLRGLGFRDVAAYCYWSQNFGYLGGDQLLFRAVK